MFAVDRRFKVHLFQHACSYSGLEKCARRAASTGRASSVTLQHTWLTTRQKHWRRRRRETRPTRRKSLTWHSSTMTGLWSWTPPISPSSPTRPLSTMSRRTGSSA
ncbi:hypothetical protein GBAR_LOCUS9900 [Geodia barretti]|uniref:Uncharacterized protein n=1 Tax=Geodia barretti TaxID=519541 RepID=A0AA35RQY1_GEOBA|nr:hypothetical protein GBAR_LOCUS9900 [Geodia barretti]